MLATMRRQITAGLALCFGVGWGLGFLVASDFNFDRRSYVGGVTYMTESIQHSNTDLWVTVDPMVACQLYVNSSSYLLDGSPSGDDFLAGCRDTYDQQADPLSTGLST